MFWWWCVALYHHASHPARGQRGAPGEGRGDGDPLPATTCPLLRVLPHLPGGGAGGAGS